MVREIKFRAWHKNLKVMIYDAMEISNVGLGEGSVVVDTRTQDGGELIWMQFIVLKDKNGKEIYDGDIVKIENGKYEVRFNNDYLCYMFYKHDFIRLPEDGKDIPITWHSKYEIEVVGNIYENS